MRLLRSRRFGSLSLARHWGAGGRRRYLGASFTAAEQPPASTLRVASTATQGVPSHSTSPGTPNEGACELEIPCHRIECPPLDWRLDRRPRRIRSADLPFCFGCLLHQTSAPSVCLPRQCPPATPLPLPAKTSRVARWIRWRREEKKQVDYKCFFAIFGTSPKWLSPWHEIPQKWNICRVEPAWPKAAPSGRREKQQLIVNLFQLSLLRRR